MITLPENSGAKRYLADQSTMAEILEGCGFSGMESVVDFGCSDGGWLWPVSRMAKSVIGIDNDSSSIARAQDILDTNKIDNVVLRTGSGLEGIATNSIDGLIMLQVLGPIGRGEFWHSCFRDALRILKPGGKILLNSFKPALCFERTVTLEGLRTTGLDRQIIWAKHLARGIFATSLRPDGYYYAPRRGLLRKFFPAAGFEIEYSPAKFAAQFRPGRLTYQHTGFFEFHDWYLLRKPLVTDFRDG